MIDIKIVFAIKYHIIKYQVSSIKYQVFSIKNNHL
jgi:hypothetical protein